MKSEMFGREEKDGIPERNDSSSVLKSDVFISYAHEDELRVRSIVAELERMGWSVFWDRTIPVGKTWHSFIEQALSASRSVVVVWSKFSVVSEWVIEEAEYAKGKKILVPLLIDAVQPPFGFKRIQAANLAGWNNDKSHPEFRKCLDAIRSIVPVADETIGQITSVVSAPAIHLPNVPPNFIRIRGGLFMMGSPSDEVHRSSDETEHQVMLSDFYICKYVVTVSQFNEFAEDTGSERKAGEFNHPVVEVSWEDADAYGKWLMAKTGNKFRLPTEAEWEYACRAGATTPFNTGDNLTTDQANYDGNYPYNGNAKGIFRQTTVPVGSFAPNAWGLYNMHGNVWEWCSDWYKDSYYEECKLNGTVTNPDNQEKGSDRVIRGGSWNYSAEYCRSAYRYNFTPVSRSSIVGFRLAFTP
ncbi:MAG: SUMF1/EgtB/PvdO family nonheme iron enzyme [Chlorobiaceae bacterium]